MVSILLISYIAACLILVFVIYIMLRPMLFGAIYFPTTPESVKTIVRLADARPGHVIADLGSGDGRILIAFARMGIEAHGYEVNPLVIKSRRAIRAAGVEGTAIVYWKSFWKTDFRRYDTVVTYGFPHIMKKLGDKLARELKPGKTVISNVFIFPTLTQTHEESRVHVYMIGDSDR